MKIENLKIRTGKIFSRRKYFTSNATCLKIGNWQSKIDNAFSLIELLVVIAILAILASMLLPALKGAKDMSKSILCIGNLKQLGLFIGYYCDDFNGHFPPATTTYKGNGSDIMTWDNYLSIYDGRNITSTLRTTYTKARGGEAIYRCPNDKEKGGGYQNYIRTYAMVRGCRFGTAPYSQRGIAVRFEPPTYPWFDSKIDMVPSPERVLSLVETSGSYCLSGDAWGAGSYAETPDSQGSASVGTLPWHGNGHAWNYLFVDGHALTLRPEQTVGPTYTPGMAVTAGANPGGYWTRDPND